MTPFPTPAEADRYERMNDHFEKFYLPDGRVLHRFTAADGPDSCFHDHPFPFLSHVGPAETDGYIEEVLTPDPDGSWAVVTIERLPGRKHYIEAGTIHRIVALRGKETWTVITPGTKEREPGFYRLIDGNILHKFWFEKTWYLWPREEAQAGA